MRIMAVMKRDDQTSDHSAPRQMPTPALCGARSFRWTLCAVVYGWVAVSSPVTMAAFPSHTQTLAAVSSAVSVIPGLEMIYPVLGLLAAVASTYILRRRRESQLAAIAAAER